MSPRAAAFALTERVAILPRSGSPNKRSSQLAVFETVLTVQCTTSLAIVVGMVLLTALWGMHEMGYAYAIIGGVGPVDFYAKACGATVIPDSTPGVYKDMLKKRST